ncbi:hypothetical protein [Clostridium aminobutyricum]|uniref:Uncharacterized protein n=1 Tax=Clostridium aminobutyricum TaxID=33953 RepID=A0A939DAJ9_CLOAM|nr:hypothetical protein [Clostridium aminobutyricum]MBN7774429.1 hypothetical protein [Clostridium aminobutyricum]
MAGKQSKNKYKEMIWDYYRTNREISKQSEEYHQNNPQQGWNTSAKVYLAIIVIGVVAILFKYFII